MLRAGMTVPLVVVTGFLGAGKTTLVNRLLARRRERAAAGKIGVIVNELGAVGIDGDLMGGEAARQVELPGGCVCCVLGDQLDTTLLELVAANPGLDAIVLETTGVAEPLPITWAVAREPVAQEVRVAAVVTLVDATHFLASRAVSASVDAQVAYADLVFITKAELAPDVAEVEAAARQLAPRALHLRGTTEEQVAWLDALLADPDDHRLPRDGAALPQESHAASRALAEASPDGQVGEHVHTSECRHDDTPAAHGIDSVWVPVGAALDLEELEDQLAELPANYVRIKGIVRAHGTDDAVRWFAVHRVGPRVSSEAVAPPESQQARLVALGPGVSASELARCVAVAASGASSSDQGSRT
jgi:G3E family GTPase